ncbi:MAG: hypothetical protein WCE81_00445 [Halobacteriota archaeon]
MELQTEGAALHIVRLGYTVYSLRPPLPEIIERSTEGLVIEGSGIKTCMAAVCWREYDGLIKGILNVIR